MNRFFNILSIISISISIILIFIIVYWLTYPYKPLVFNDSVFRIKNKEVKAGGNLVYISNYCKYMNLNAIVSRTFNNGLIFITPPTTTGRPVGCAIINVNISIPTEIPEGKYYLENIYVYQVNPFRTIIVSHKSEEFTVKGRDEL